MIGIYDDMEQSLGMTKLHRALPLGMRASLWSNASPEVRHLLDCVTLKDAIEITGIGPVTLRSWVKSGRIPSTEWRGQTILRLSEIKRAIDSPPARGRPLTGCKAFTRW